MNEILKKRLEIAANEYSNKKFWEEEDYYARECMDIIAPPAFVAGAEYALQNQWIRVEEALPQVEADGCSEYVLVMSLNLIPQIASYSDGSNTTKYTYKGKDGKKHEAHWFLLDFSPILYDITHWMPIPELKKKENGE